MRKLLNFVFSIFGAFLLILCAMNSFFVLQEANMAQNELLAQANTPLPTFFRYLSWIAAQPLTGIFFLAAAVGLLVKDFFSIQFRNKFRINLAALVFASLYLVGVSLIPWAIIS